MHTRCHRAGADSRGRGPAGLSRLLVLYEQNRHSYFRAWQLAWAAYTLHYALKAGEYFQGPSAVLFFLSSLLLGGDGDLHLRLRPA